MTDNELKIWCLDRQKKFVGYSKVFGRVGSTYLRTTPRSHTPAEMNSKYPIDKSKLFWNKFWRRIQHSCYNPYENVFGIFVPKKRR
jgi:hypothetical protein